LPRAFQGNSPILTAHCRVDPFDIRARSERNDAELVAGEHLYARLRDDKGSGRLPIHQLDIVSDGDARVVGSIKADQDHALASSRLPREATRPCGSYVLGLGGKAG
jgi:hypothetical protein